MASIASAASQIGPIVLPPQSATDRAGEELRQQVKFNLEATTVANGVRIRNTALIISSAPISRSSSPPFSVRILRVVGGVEGLVQEIVLLQRPLASGGSIVLPLCGSLKEYSVTVDPDNNLKERTKNDNEAFGPIC